jgi:hypothetical protein
LFFLIIGLKAENYLLNCRVETISSPSKQAPRIFQTSPEHPNARIIISPPYASKSTSSPREVFDPQPPSKPRKTDDRRTSSRKRTATEKYDFTSDSDSDEKSRRSKPQESRRRKSAKVVESAESTPRKNKSPNTSKSNREKEPRLDRKENEELYETLQKQVTIDLLKRRYFLVEVSDCSALPTVEQEDMVMEICRKMGVEKNHDLVVRAATSVRYWVAHKSWRLRDHFKVLGTLFLFKLIRSTV